MSRNLLLAALIAGASTAAIGQVLMPGGAKPVAKPVMPVMVVPATPTTRAPVGPVSADRTIALLKAAGIVNPANVDRPITLTPRAPYVDPLTYLGVIDGEYLPNTGLITIEPNPSVSWALVSWNPSPDRRYVLDCAFQISDGADLTFRWETQRTDHASIVGGHAGIVLPPGVQPPVQIGSQSKAYLSQCDITPFGS